MTHDANVILEGIRQAISKLPPNNDGEIGITAAEFADAQGIPIVSARDQLYALRKAGTLKLVKVRRQRYDDIWTTVNGFRPVA